MAETVPVETRVRINNKYKQPVTWTAVHKQYCNQLTNNAIMYLYQPINKLKLKLNAVFDTSFLLGSSAPVYTMSIPQTHSRLKQETMVLLTIRLQKLYTAISDLFLEVFANQTSVFHKQLPVPSLCLCTVQL